MSEEHRRDSIQGEIVHVYDGIEEADNRLPNWWLWTFYGAIIFGAGYWFYLHDLEAGPTAYEEYAAYVAENAAAQEADEATLTMLVNDQGTLAEGQETFQTTCAACHGDRGQGEIGPNLTDDRWLHGGSPIAIYRSIRVGITSDQALIEGSAGMPGWGAQLGERRVQAVTAYLLSIRNTAVAGREPEGEPWDPSAGEPATEEASGDSAPPEG